MLDSRSQSSYEVDHDMLSLSFCLVLVIRDIIAGDRWSLFQKCEIAQRFVFIEFDFRCLR